MGRVAYFISPHGFGHAARSCAVMEGLLRRWPASRFDLFTEVPPWFFSESLPRCFTYHRLASDIGLVQNSALIEDLEATVKRLDNAPFHDPGVIDTLGERLRRLRCSLVISDISPLGLEVAARIGLSSVLVENFTWDWIYANYPDAPPSLGHHGRDMAAAFSRADLRIQATPVCEPVANGVTVPPVARAPRTPRGEIRSRLGVPEDEPMVLLSMGGAGWDYGRLDELGSQDRAWIVVPGGGRTARRRGRLLVLPFHGGFYHPDLVAASDVVVGKLGYSTVAEAFHAGSAFAYVARPNFPESPVLAAFVEQHMAAMEIEETAFRCGSWLQQIEPLLAVPRKRPKMANGAEAAANAILDLLSI
ncbi:MAG: hypothetical protein IFK91_04265 [Acidobacteria bacterium]|nr:hypothetical protein [Candidatus Sulfomarinibacter sp. MAG AM1]